jgi:hypothetical protein
MLADTVYTDFIIFGNGCNIQSVTNTQKQKISHDNNDSYKVQGLNRDLISDQTKDANITINDRVSCCADLSWNDSETKVLGSITFNINNRINTYPISGKHIYSDPFLVDNKEYTIDAYFANHWWFYENMYIEVKPIKGITKCQI